MSTSPESLVDRWRALRDRLLANPRFQRWAAAFPLTRPIATRQASALFDLVAGFVYSQVLAACVRLHLFDHLAAGPRGLDDLARALDLPAAGARRLLDAAAALDLVEARGPERYGLGMLGAALRGNPGVTALIEHHDMLYADLADPLPLLRGTAAPTRMQQFWAYARASNGHALEAGQVERYTALMAASQHLVASEILDAYPVGRHRCLLDVGGGDGSFLAAAAARAPHLALMLFDLPAVAEQARARLAERGLADRSTVHGGSFRTDPLPTGADLISLVRVVHDHDDEVAMDLLRCVRAALAPGGVLLLAEPMADTRGARPMGAAYFGWYLMAMGSGRPRTEAQLQAMAQAAGFGQCRPARVRRPLMTRVLVCSDRLR
ncbi:MAG TPA: methyltransferase [Rubrivivax sp.]|nr:methyltransferase [Rubrivivax sp.]